MRDRDGQEHADDSPVTWGELIWFFDREMAHRDRLQAKAEEAVETAAHLEKERLRAIIEKRAASNRMLVAIVGILLPLLFYLLSKTLLK